MSNTVDAPQQPSLSPLAHPTMGAGVEGGEPDPKGMKLLISSWEGEVLVYPRVGTTLWNRLF